MKIRQPIEQRLEQALRVWEDTTYLNQLLVRAAGNIPEIRQTCDLHTQFKSSLEANKYGIVRDRLLHAVTSTPATELLQRTDFPTDDALCYEELLWELFGWCRSSRRAYRIPTDLQLLLQTTSLRGLWTDIRLPFNAFAVYLEEPLIHPDGRAFDTLIFHRHGDEECSSYSLVLIPSEYRQYCPISASQREHLERKIRSGDLYNVAITGRKLLKKITKSYISLSFEKIPLDQFQTEIHFNNSSGRTSDILKQFEESDAPESRIMHLAFQLAIGLSHYLLNFPQKERGESVRGPAQTPHPPLRIVTSGTHVCTVQGSFEISREEREVFREFARGREISSPFFREGYYSRPPGLGSDPLAARTIWHRPTIVRRDLLPEGTLPQGKEARIPSVNSKP